MTTSQNLRKQNIGWEFKIQIPTGPPSPHALWGQLKLPQWVQLRLSPELSVPKKTRSKNYTQFLNQTKFEDFLKFFERFKNLKIFSASHQRSHPTNAVKFIKVARPLLLVLLCFLFFLSVFSKKEKKGSNNLNLMVHSKPRTRQNNDGQLLPRCWLY